LYAGDDVARAIRKFAPDGSATVLDGFGAMYSFALAVDAAANVYVVDGGNGLIWKAPPGGLAVKLAGSAVRIDLKVFDGVGADANFSGPTGVAAGPDDYLYVADPFGFGIRKISPTGVVTTLQRGASNYALTFDAFGKLYVAGKDSNQIFVGEPLQAAVPKLRIVQSGSQVIVLWPTSLTGFGLESATSLAAPVQWVSQTNGIGVSANLNAFTNDLGGAVRYYRLKK
jgi:hypothetical protein